MIIGEHIRPMDLVINPIVGKKLTNMRASGTDGTTKITPKRLFSLEECMEYVDIDEAIEVTPKSIRMRKLLLNEEDRKRESKRFANAD